MLGKGLPGELSFMQTGLVVLYIRLLLLQPKILSGYIIILIKF